MMKSSKKINIPVNELKFIKPEIRQKLFLEICNGYPKRYNVKLMYAYLNSDPEIIVDYLVMYSARNDENTADLILFDIPPIHSIRSTPGYRYCRRTHKEDEFYEYGIDDIVVIEKDKFYEFITSIGLDRDKNSEFYWKKPENASELLSGLLDLSLRYNKRR